MIYDIVPYMFFRKVRCSLNAAASVAGFLGEQTLYAIQALLAGLSRCG